MALERHKKNEPVLKKVYTGLKASLSMQAVKVSFTPRFLISVNTPIQNLMPSVSAINSLRALTRNLFLIFKIDCKSQVYAFQAAFSVCLAFSA
jgi:hypothetical protein